MKRYEELSYDERTEVKAIFANWLCKYSNEVIKAVMKRSEEILNNEFAMNLLRELATRENKEMGDFERSLDSLFTDYEKFEKYDIHNHPLEHASAYRSVLYDMYIAEI